MLILNMKMNEYVEIIEGTKPILLSAPHVHAHRRPSLTLSYKLGEEYTDRIVEDICYKTGVWGIIQSKETPFDANFHKFKENPYKQSVADIIESGKISKFVDIHGLNLTSEYDLGIYYPSKYRRSINFSKEVRSAIDKNKLKGINCCMLRLQDDMEETLGEFVASKFQIPAVQLEVARYIRESDKLRRELVFNLASYILNIH